MKRISLLLIAVTSLVLCLLACSKEETNNETASLKVSDFSAIGALHNDFLSNVNSRFILRDSATEQQKIAQIAQFNIEFANSLDIERRYKEILISNLNDTKEFVNEEVLINRSFGNLDSLNIAKTGDNNENIFEQIEFLKSNGTINADSYQILMTLSNDLKANYEGNLSDDQLKMKVNQLINDFDSYAYEANGEGEMVGTILAISIASINWWEQNPDALDNLQTKNSATQKVAIAPWLAADLVGGAVSGVVAASGQATINGEVKWSVVAWSALGGAVSSSTGAVGKIIKWLKL